MLFHVQRLIFLSPYSEIRLAEKYPAYDMAGFALIGDVFKGRECGLVDWDSGNRGSSPGSGTGLLGPLGKP